MIEAEFLLLLCLVSITQVPDSKRVECPDIVRAITDFDAKQFMGTWYEVQKFFPTLGKARNCVAATYSPYLDNSINVVLERVDEVTHKPKRFQGLIKNVGSLKVANLMVNIPLRRPQLFKIIDIDYKNYFVAFSCLDRLSAVWIFSKKQVLDDSHLQKAYSALAIYPTLKPSLFQATNQTNCPEII